jgi:hypothetical protein
METKPTIQEAFLEYHQANPHVYARLEQLSQEFIDLGVRRIGIDLFINQVRYERIRTTRDAQGFKINQNFSSRYARLLLDNNPDWEGLFELRSLRTP